MKDEALKLALDALDIVKIHFTQNRHVNEAITAIKQARALDKKAENARELGLDYEPVQDSTCNETLRAQGKAYPRTCRKCGKGPCIGAPKPPPAQPAPVQDIEHCIWARNGNTPCPHTTQPAAQPAVQEPFCFYYVENGEEYFAPKGAYVPDNAQPLYTTPPAQPAVPDAFGTREGEHPEYIQGWNDCRAEMLRGMKP